MDELPRLGAAPRQVRTERLDLRAFAADDLDAYLVLSRSEGFWTYPFGRVPTDEEVAAIVRRAVEAWDANGWGSYLAVERASGLVAGQVNLGWASFLPAVMPALDLGWRLVPEARGRGLATEGARAVAAVAFEHLGVDRCVVVIEPDNVASAAVAGRLGLGHPSPAVATFSGREVPVDVRWLEPRHVRPAP